MLTIILNLFKTAEPAGVLREFGNSPLSPPPSPLLVAGSPSLVVGS